MEANITQLTFQWSSVAPSYCESARYLINASNCGHCPNVTNDTTAICIDFALDMYSQVCLLSVWTVVCDNVTGNESSSVQVNLRGTHISRLSCICNNKCDIIIFIKCLTPLRSMLSQRTLTVAKLY